jgi:hypothetical protein
MRSADNEPWPVASGTGGVLKPAKDMPGENKEIVRTSQPGWLEALAKVYKNRRPALLIDDAGIGVDPSSETLFDMAKKAKLSAREISAVCIALGMSAVGIVMVISALFDPEPTSKVGLLLVGGVTCLLGGGFTAIHILTKHKPPNIRVTAEGFELSWA